MNLHNIEFVKSAATAKDFISDNLPLIVFTGKSNVGKSSVINKLFNRNKLARVSSVPGKTIHINYYLADKKAYIVDLPGYGYAKTSKTHSARWSGLMESFFSHPGKIALAVMIVDFRHKPTADDIIMVQFLKASGCRYIVLANKEDKLKRSEKELNTALIWQTLELPEDAAIIPFSAKDGTGTGALLACIKESLGIV